MSNVIVPDEVRELIGGALVEAQIQKFWTHCNQALSGQSPQEVWGLGEEGKKRVRDLINSAKSGDMA